MRMDSYLCSSYQEEIKAQQPPHMTVRGDTVMFLDASRGLDILDQPDWSFQIGRMRMKRGILRAPAEDV